jgi:hypothetical protein
MNCKFTVQPVEPNAMKHGYTFLLLVSIAHVQPLHAQYAAGALDVNNVYGEVRSNGLISYDAQTGQPGFFVPYTPGIAGPSPLFAAGLWIGGLSPDNILFFAGERFEQNGHDFFPGPLGTGGTISQQTSDQYDAVQMVNRVDVVQQIAYFQCLSDPNCDEALEFPGYQVPASFFQWPAHGDVGLGQAYQLADFIDFNNNGEYDPGNGDAPCFPGDQALFTIYNDKLAPHSESGGLPLGVEVQMTPFAYASNNPAVNQSNFVRYKLINRGTQSFHQAYIGLFNDFDLGCADDDHIQCDVGRNMFFVLNGDDVDEDCNGHLGYGTPSPAFGVVILKGPLMDADGTDNTGPNMLPGFNGTGFNDGIADNERLGMGHSGYFQNTSGPTGDPDVASEYYNHMKGLWNDNTPLTYGASGYNAGTDSLPARFAFPGDTDPLGVGTNGIPKPAWTQETSGFPPGDQRGFASMGPFTFNPGDEQEIVIAYLYARPATAGANARVETLNERADSLRAFAGTIPGLLDGEYDCSQLPTAITSPAAKDRGLHLYPNPANDQVVITLPDRQGPCRITLLNTLGATVLDKTADGPRTELDLAQVPAGLYLVRVILNGHVHDIRIVKQ